jgi:hypothetical protein
LLLFLFTISSLSKIHLVIVISLAIFMVNSRATFL